MRAKWVVYKRILKEPYENLPEIIRSLGYECCVVDQNIYSEAPFEIPYNQKDCVVLYGSHQFVRRTIREFGFAPGAYGINEKMNSMTYMANIPGEWFLNDDHVFVTWKEFRRRKDFWFKIYNNDNVFIRPNSGYKTFTGQTMSKAEFDTETHSMDILTSAMPETMIMVSSIKKILSEYRFVIANKKVITGSQYSWEQLAKPVPECDESCRELAQKVANLEWQIDTCYTCDVCLTPDGPRIVELNSFACAGLYACNLADIIRGVSAAATKDWLHVN